jgi:hypothetical protein
MRVNTALTADSIKFPIDELVNVCSTQSFTHR